MSFKVGEQVRIVSGLLGGEIGTVHRVHGNKAYSVAHGGHGNMREYEYFEEELESAEEELESAEEDHKYQYEIMFVNDQEAVVFEEPVSSTEGVYVLGEDDRTTWIMIPWHRITSISKRMVE